MVGGVGLGSDPLRDLAVAVLLAAGLVLIVPGLADGIEARLSRLSALGPRTRGDGFASGLVVGAALGFVYTPCAGPILAAVISVSAVSGRSLAVAIAYAVGTGAMLLALTLGGRALFDRVRRAGRGPALQRTLGAIMVITAVAIATELDVNFDQYVAQHIPDVNLTASLEESHAVQSRLPQLTGHGVKYQASVGAPSAPRSASRELLLADARDLPNGGPAPEFMDTEDWFNTPGGPAADARRPARARGVDRLLDLHLHQLHSHAALPEGLGCRLPQGRPDDRGRRDAGVRVRARAPATSPTRSTNSASATRSCRTTKWARGTRTTTSTGRPTT